MTREQKTIKEFREKFSKYSPLDLASIIEEIENFILEKLKEQREEYEKGTDLLAEKLIELRKELNGQRQIKDLREKIEGMKIVIDTTGKTEVLKRLNKLQQSAFNKALNQVIKNI